jgi:GMP synthase-like glutamine amidotransferase
MSVAQEAPRILVLDYSTDRSLGPATARWLPAGCEVHSWTMLDGEPLPALEGFTHLLHTGSALSINDDPPFLAGALALVRQAVDRGLPQLGICYGHQLLSRALGGRRAVRRCPAGPEIGWLPVAFTERGQAQFGVPARCVIWQYHHDEVVALPHEAQVLASSPHCAVQAFHDPLRRLTGTQFHPEVDLALGTSMYLDKAEDLAAKGFDARALVLGRPEGFDLRAVLARLVTGS